MDPLAEERKNIVFQEETVFNIRFNLEVQFPEDYDGEEDNMVWIQDWEARIKPDLLKTIFSELRKYPLWSARVRNRGKSVSDEVEIALVKHVS